VFDRCHGASCTGGECTFVSSSGFDGVVMALDVSTPTCAPHFIPTFVEEVHVYAWGKPTVAGEKAIWHFKIV
jgi:hypothetical protein